MTLLEDFNIVSNTSSKDWKTAGDNVQYMVKGDTLYLQPSNGKEDWRNNFDFFPVDYSDGVDTFGVHEGFLRAWLSAKEVITKLPYTRIVGYSHGGALAVLAHKEFRDRWGVQPRTIVFGCPRCLHNPPDIVELKVSMVRRYENPRDIVANVPFLSMGFVHAGKRTVLKNKAKRGDVKLLEWISGHCPSMYKQNLEGV